MPSTTVILKGDHSIAFPDAKGWANVIGAGRVSMIHFDTGDIEFGPLWGHGRPMRRICLELPIVGMDVVEVSPPYDHADITAALANRVVLENLCAIARKRQDLRDGYAMESAAAAAQRAVGANPRRASSRIITTPLSHDQEK